MKDMITCKVCNQIGNGYCAKHSTSGMAYYRKHTMDTMKLDDAGIVDTQSTYAPKDGANPIRLTVEERQKMEDAELSQQYFGKNRGD